MISLRFLRKRQRRNMLIMGLCYGAACVGLTALILILWTLGIRGISGLSWGVFTEVTPVPGDEGGLLNAIIGSVMMTSVALFIGLPIGFLAGTWLAEYGRYTRFAFIIRFINDILLSAPSIIIGLFIYECVVVSTHHYSAIAGALALAVIVIPIVVRTTEDMLSLVPNALREAAIALGLPRSYMIKRIAYRAVRTGLITGILLATARISGETAPLLFTALSNPSLSFDLTHEMANLPVVINNFAGSPYPSWRDLAWVGALIITLFVLILSIIARFLSAQRIPK